MTAAAQALGAYIHHVNSGLTDTSTKVGDAFTNAVSAAPGVIGDNVGAFVHGLWTGEAPATAKAAPSKAAAPAAATPAAKTAAADPMTQFIAAQIATQSKPGYVDQPTPTPVDVMRNALAARGGMSLSQFGALADSIGKVVPQAVRPVPMTSKEVGGQQFLAQIQDYANRVAQNPEYAKTDLGATQRQLIEDYRGYLAQPNQINDVATGMPIQTGA